MLENEIKVENIAKLVKLFYAKVRKHNELGQIFNNAIDDWPEHLEKLTLFWKDRMLGTREFVGHPPKAHLALPPFDTALFEEWLRLFHATADEIYIPEISALYKEKSRNIAVNLKRIVELKRFEG